MALLATSCSSEAPFYSEEAGEGCLRMSVALDNSTRAYEALEYSTLRIYSDEGLIRKYSPVTDCPDNLYLAAGGYRAIVEAGDGSEATWTNKSYCGEQEFTITPKQTTTIEVVCTLINSAVRIVYDETVPAKFQEGAATYVSARDTFSKTEAENNSVPTLKYELSETRNGYFLLPEDVTKLSWGFYGTLAGDGSAVEMTSTKNNQEIVPQAGYLYTLTFKYSDTPGGSMALTVKVEEEPIASYEDSFLFSPEPTISGDGFSTANVVAYTGGDLSFTVASVNRLTDLSITAEGTTYLVMASGMVADGSADGIAYMATDDYNGVVTLSADFFAKLDSGIRSVSFVAADESAGEGKTTARIAIQGLAGAECDLWANTASLQAVITDASVTDVSVRYRRQGDSAWTTVPASLSENYTYVASVTPVWAESTNDEGFAVYSLTDGIRANNTYEYQLVIAGTGQGTVQSFSTATEQVIPYGDMESSDLTCFTQDNSAAKYWGSGNNSMTPSLCTQSSFSGMGGSHCALLTATSTFGFMAAGNLFLGTFNRPGMNGYVDFGHSYEWEARPVAMKLKLHATIGTVNINKHSGPLATGDQDKGQVFVAVIDWDTPHRVQSGTAAPEGIWSPAGGADVVAEGKVIGYGIYEVGSTAGDSMEEVTVPIVYYDTTAKPSKTYTLTIACSTSAYGDYMDGCDENTMYVDDFEWVY